MTSTGRNTAMCLGENGRLQYASSGCMLTDTLFQLVRKCPEERINRFEAVLKATMKVIGADPSLGAAEMDVQLSQVLVDAWLIWAHTRGVRDGKGEKLVSMLWFCRMARLFPKSALEMVPLVPLYGSWMDVVLYIEHKGTPEAIRDAMLMLMVDQIRIDLLELERHVREGTKRPSSLVGKWAPRERGAHGGVAKQLARLLFPGDPQCRKRYRRAVAALSSDVTEVKMCGGDWSGIVPGRISARCLTNNRMALMNEKAKQPGVARSADPDRQQCARQLKAHIEECKRNPGGKARLHGKNQHPHEIVSKYIRGAAEDDVLEAQWVDVREGARAAVSIESPDSKQNGALGNLVAMVDVSGSMSGTPMEVAVTLGILISELTHPAFRNRFLTFSSEPKWCRLEPDWSLWHKVCKARAANWEMSTDMSKAIQAILHSCVENHVPADEVADLTLVVLSDMQFDVAQGHLPIREHHRRAAESPGISCWETQHEELERMFSEAGYPCVPRVIFWNLRGDTHGQHAPATCDTVGVDMVSGFSPDLLKLFMSGGDMSGQEVKQSTPQETARKALDNPAYDAVREACQRVCEWRSVAWLE